VVRVQDLGVRSLATVFLFLGSYVVIGIFYLCFARQAIARHPSDSWPDVMDEFAPDSTTFSGWN
jgi:hypothetical protein